MIFETQLQKIAYEKINDKFSYGRYGDFKVILMSENGYINVTKLCALEGKRFENWLQNKQSVNLVESVNSELFGPDGAFTGIQVNGNFSSEIKEKCLICIRGSSLYETQIRGTYAHPLLVPHIASWCSSKFAIRVSKIVNNFMIREHLNTIAIQYELLGKQEKENSDLKKEIKLQTELIQKLREATEQQNKLLETTHSKIDQVSENLIETHEEVLDVKHQVVEANHRIETVQEKTNVPVEARIPIIKPAPYLESFVLLKMNGVNSKFEYYVIRGQKHYVQTRAKQFAKTNDCQELMHFSYEPYPKNLFVRMKTKMKKNLTFYANWCSKFIGFSEADMVSEIKKLAAVNLVI